MESVYNHETINQLVRTELLPAPRKSSLTPEFVDFDYSNLPTVMIAKSSVMDEFVIKKAIEDDADDLYDLMNESVGTKISLTRANFRQDLAGVYEPSDINRNLFTPNCPVCQAYLAVKGNQIIGYILFHYHYTPWVGRVAFINDIYVKQNYRGKGIAKRLVRGLSELCKRQNVVSLLFSSTNMSPGLIKKAESYNAKFVRDENSTWSVYRIEFK